MKAVYGSTVLAEATADQVVKIEGNWYFPPATITADAFAESDTAYHCPWKGDAQYWDLEKGDDRLPDGAWSYPDLLPGAVERVGTDFAGYVAFDRRVTIEE